MAKDEARIQLLARIARRDVAGQKPTSILSLSAAAYGARPNDEATVPTGFDPHAVALFEAIVEAAYLVAVADGQFDDTERKTFEKVVVSACGGTVAARQVQGLIADLGDQLKEDGLDARVKALSWPVQKVEHAHEVLRIASLLADASEGISDVERGLLEKIAVACKLAPSDVDTAIADVRAAIGAGASA